MYRVYYKINGVDFEYKYATTVGFELLDQAIMECFEDEEVTLLIIEYNIELDMDNLVPYFLGSNQRYKEIRNIQKVKQKMYDTNTFQIASM